MSQTPPIRVCRLDFVAVHMLTGLSLYIGLHGDAGRQNEARRAMQTEQVH